MVMSVEMMYSCHVGVPTKVVTIVRDNDGGCSWW